LILSVVVSD
jgi:hypothetical protein